MTFSEAIKTGFQKFLDFDGRAGRAEFWLWVLFLTLARIIFYILDPASLSGGPVSMVFSIVTFLPSLAVSVRRIHDVGKSGWWLFCFGVPLVGWFFTLMWMITRGNIGENLYGDDPLIPKNDTKTGIYYR